MLTRPRKDRLLNGNVFELNGVESTGDLPSGTWGCIKETLRST